LGNRHLPTEIRHDILHIRPDHVIEDMLHRFEAVLVRVEAPFQPEGGAYMRQRPSSRPRSHGASA
jgi:urease accessory protein